ncbi:MAG: 50S ribosomal protein L29 [Chloroflexi bacterium RBG_13_50_10]|nr:MAG: 50S ribosomal protein L29 [Chloroflexi bacterium RBG_13_50_10]
MKIDEVRSLGDAELLKRLDEARQELFNIKLRMATRQLANHREFPKVKKKIARIETIIREREYGIR